MRLGIVTALVLALVTGACDDDTGTADDGGTDDVAPEDTATPDDVETPEDVVDLVEDTAEEADAFTCPDVTPEDVTLTHEQVSRVIVIAGQATTQVSAAICRYEPAYEWATRLGEASGCRVLHWLPTVLPTGTNLDTGDITVEIDGTAYPLAAAEGAPTCYRAPTGTVPEVAAGTTVRAWSTGGTDVPAFDLTTTVPELPTIDEPVDGATLTACLPWTMAWTPADAPHVSAWIGTTLADSRSFAISCRDLSSSPLVIPAELTTLWTTERDGAHLSLSIMSQVASTTDPAVTLDVSYEAQGSARVTIVRP